MSDEQLRPKVGLGVMVMKDGKALLGRRNKDASHGDQLWCMPGGNLEYGESIVDGAMREVMEESGVEIKNIQFTMLANEMDFWPKHYIGIGLVADWKAGEPRPEAGDKMTDWGWYDPNNLPEPIYGLSKKLAEAWMSGELFHDAPTRK